CSFPLLYQHVTLQELVMRALPEVRWQVVYIEEWSTQTQFIADSGLRGRDVFIEGSDGLLLQFGSNTAETQADETDDQRTVLFHTDSCCSSVLFSSCVDLCCIRQAEV